MYIVYYIVYYEYENGVPRESSVLPTQPQTTDTELFSFKQKYKIKLSLKNHRWQMFGPSKTTE